jgi:nicotinate-nucleotide adenylyltransferase
VVAPLKLGRDVEVRLKGGADHGELVFPRAGRPTVHQPLLTSLRGLTGRIGIFGGTFDPIHVGHPECAHQALQVAALSSVIFVPTAKNPLKKEGPQAGNIARLEMLLRALDSEPQFFVSPVQLLGQVASFSIDLVAHIAEESPLAELYLIVGSDCLSTLSAWKDIHALLKIAKLVVVERPGYPVTDTMKLEGFSKEEHAAIFGRVVRGLTKELSSSRIRSELKDGSDVQGVLPKGVASLIKERGLYTRESRRQEVLSSQ